MEKFQAPLFPLPDTILFPGQIMPLHIFEPRYREMTHDLLDGKGELIVGTVLDDDQEKLSEVAPVQRVAGLGRLERYEKLPQGRYLVIVLGLARVDVFPIASSKSYPMADYVINHDDLAIADSLRDQVKELVESKQEFNALPDATSAAQLVDMLIMTAEISVADKYSFFAIQDLPERASRIIDAYENG